MSSLSAIVVDASMTNVKSKQKRSLEELLEGFDANDIAKYLTKITNKAKNNSDSVNLSENTSELAYTLYIYIYIYICAHTRVS